MREYQTRLSGDQPKNRYSVRFLTKDGQEKYVLISSTLVNWDGAPAALAMISDISMQKKIESDLRKSEERFRQLMEQSPWPTVILSPDGKIILVNSAFNKLWNLSDEEEAEVIAKYNILTDPQYEKLGLMEMVKKAFEGKHTILPPIQYDNSQTADDFNIELLNDFKSPWIQLHLNSVKDEKGQIAYIVSTYMDLTDLKNAEQKIQEQRDLLARMSRANEMGQLTASIAHELNQPLTGILSNAQAAELILKSKNWDLEEIKEILAEIIGDTKRAGEVIRNLRELYRDQKVEFLPIEMNTILNEITKLLHSEFVMQHVVLQTKYGSSLPMIGGNKIQIQQVMVNLIMNGIQAMIGMDSGERKILITSSSDANEVKVFVADRGKGINPDIIDRIFEPLATWKPGGTGMGLAISNSIIKAHGGRMMAENRREGGARVGFALPVIKEDL
jgi:C4-dicarboxylate-specific signal transduction histidine kinase